MSFNNINYELFKNKKTGVYRVIKPVVFKLIWWKFKFNLTIGFVNIKQLESHTQVWTQSDINSHYRLSDFKCVSVFFDKTTGLVSARYSHLIGYFIEISAEKNVKEFDLYFTKTFKDVVLMFVK